VLVLGAWIEDSYRVRGSLGICSRSAYQAFLLITNQTKQKQLSPAFLIHLLLPSYKTIKLI